VSAYLDASVLVTRTVTEPGSAAFDAFLEGYDDDLGVSDFAAAEVASVVSRMVRTHLIAAETAVDRLLDFDTWRTIRTGTINLDPSDARLANTYVRRFDLMLKAPDALHAAICRRLDLTLVTLDRRLATAARELGVNVIVPAV
jgi:predicted nucleic acid-binding protein